MNFMNQSGMCGLKKKFDVQEQAKSADDYVDSLLNHLPSSQNTLLKHYASLAGPNSQFASACLISFQKLVKEKGSVHPSFCTVSVLVEVLARLDGCEAALRSVRGGPSLLSDLEVHNLHLPIYP